MLSQVVDGTRIGSDQIKDQEVMRIFKQRCSESLMVDGISLARCFPRSCNL